MLSMRYRITTRRSLPRPHFWDQWQQVYYHCNPTVHSLPSKGSCGFRSANVFFSWLIKSQQPQPGPGILDHNVSISGKCRCFAEQLKKRCGFDPGHEETAAPHRKGMHAWVQMLIPPSIVGLSVSNVTATYRRCKLPRVRSRTFFGI